MLPVKGGVTHFSLKNLLPDRVRGTFPACFFSGSLFFYSVSPNALAICWRLPRGQQTSVCRQTLSASPLSPFSHQLSPLQGHRLTSVRAINCTNDQAWAQTPPPLPPYPPETPSTHIQLTLPLSVLSIPKTCFPQGQTFLLCHLLIASGGCIQYFK